MNAALLRRSARVAGGRGWLAALVGFAGLLGVLVLALAPARAAFPGANGKDRVYERT